MREILFRGKRVDNGEWIEGCLVIRKDTGNNAINCYIIRPSYVHFNNSHIVHTEVDPDTVCEFTGLFDKNGKKIFENDLVKVRYVEKRKFGATTVDDITEEIEEVVFYNSGFRLHIKFYGIDFYRDLVNNVKDQIKIKDLEIIGNRWEKELV